jgi:PAS domain S-box-containing protein
MPRARKKGELPKQVRKSKKGPAKLEPLHPKPDLLDKSYNDLVKFPDENPYPVLRIHKNGTLLYANKASEPLLKAKGGSIGRPAPADWHRLVKKTLSSGQVIREETEHNGRIFAFRIVPIAGSNYVNFYGVDITERKTAYEKLQTSEEKLTNAMKIAKLGYWEYDAVKDEFTFNDQFYSIFRTTAEKVGGYTMSSARYAELFIPPEERGVIDIEVKKALETADPNFSSQLEHRIIYGDGQTGYIAVRFFIIKDSSGRTIRTYGANQDITENKRLEETLEKERKELKLIIDSSPIIVFYKDKEGKFVRINKALAEAIEIPEEKFLGKTVFDLYSKQIAKAMTKDDQEVLRTGRSKLNIVEQYESKKGLRWVQTDKVPIFDKNGDIAGLVGFAQDITERLQAEKSVKLSEKRFRELFNNMSSGVAVYEAVDNGQDFVFKDFNNAGQKIDKILKKDVLGKRVTEIYPGIKAMGLLDVFQSVWSSGKAEHHPAVIYKDKRITGWRENYVYKLPGGEIVAVYDDTTEQMQARENLQKERNLLRTLIDHIPDPVYLKDTESRFIACNKALLKFWGLNNDSKAIGKTDFDFFEKQRAQQYFDEEQKVMQTSRPVINREGQCPDNAGNLHSFLVTKLPLQDSHGNVTGIVGINRDITVRKIAENKLLDYHKQLKKLTAQLALTEERERHRIARGLHDQVNQSLALAKIKLDSLLASDKAFPLAETLREINETVEKAIQNTRSLTFDLSYPILYELGFEEAVSDWLLEQIQKKHGINTEFYDDGCAKPIDDDVRVLLFRNIRELLINIIKHARADKIKVSVAKADDSIIVKVEDNGIGFNIDDITASRKGGFGLFSIRESVGEFGGSFEIDSKPGAGCKVTMTAPLKGKQLTQE